MVNLYQDVVSFEKNLRIKLNVRNRGSCQPDEPCGPGAESEVVVAPLPLVCPNCRGGVRLEGPIQKIVQTRAETL